VFLAKRQNEVTDDPSAKTPILVVTVGQKRREAIEQIAQDNEITMAEVVRQMIDYCMENQDV
jgi:uncharacterized protein YdbL (DUF1318 family)